MLAHIKISAKAIHQHRALFDGANGVWALKTHCAACPGDIYADTEDGTKRILTGNKVRGHRERHFLI